MRLGKIGESVSGKSLWERYVNGRNTILTKRSGKKTVRNVSSLTDGWSLGDGLTTSP